MDRVPILDEKGTELLRTFIEGLPNLSSEQKLVVLEMLEIYLKEIQLWNPRLGLIEAIGHEVLTKHVFDCLIALEYFQNEFTSGKTDFADIGTGAGLPGLLLAMVMPQAKWTLVEKQARRTAFLTNIQKLAGVKNTKIIGERYEDLDENFDIITSRAFAPLSNDVMKEYLRLLKPDGKLILYKAKLDKINSELASIDQSNLKIEIKEIKNAHLLDERHLVIVSK